MAGPPTSSMTPFKIPSAKERRSLGPIEVRCNRKRKTAVDFFREEGGKIERTADEAIETAPAARSLDRDVNLLAAADNSREGVETDSGVDGAQSDRRMQASLPAVEPSVAKITAAVKPVVLGHASPQPGPAAWPASLSFETNTTNRSLVPQAPVRLASAEKYLSEILLKVIYLQSLDVYETFISTSQEELRLVLVPGIDAIRVTFPFQRKQVGLELPEKLQTMKFRFGCFPANCDVLALRFEPNGVKVLERNEDGGYAVSKDGRLTDSLMQHVNGGWLHCSAKLEGQGVKFYAKIRQVRNRLFKDQQQASKKQKNARVAPCKKPVEAEKNSASQTGTGTRNGSRVEEQKTNVRSSPDDGWGMCSLPRP